MPQNARVGSGFDLGRVGLRIFQAVPPRPSKAGGTGGLQAERYLDCLALVGDALRAAVRGRADTAGLAGVSDVATALAQPLFERQPAAANSCSAVLNSDFVRPRGNNA